eukprot:jgi/Mesen1/2776/ME000170S01872
MFFLLLVTRFTRHLRLYSDSHSDSPQASTSEVSTSVMKMPDSGPAQVTMPPQQVSLGPVPTPHEADRALKSMLEAVQRMQGDSYHVKDLASVDGDDNILNDGEAGPPGEHLCLVDAPSGPSTRSKTAGQSHRGGNFMSTAQAVASVVQDPRVFSAIERNEQMQGLLQRHTWRSRQQGLGPLAGARAGLAAPAAAAAPSSSKRRGDATWEALVRTLSEFWGALQSLAVDLLQSLFGVHMRAALGRTDSADQCYLFLEVVVLAIFLVLGILADRAAAAAG